MFTKFILSTISIILLISLAGCGMINQSKPSGNDINNEVQNNPPDTNPDTNGSENYQMLPVISGNVANLKLDAGANGTTQSIKNGEVVSISLESNLTTGYSWFATISNSSVLVQMGDPEYQGASSDTTATMIGAPGTQTFYFQGTSPGITTLTLDYKRSWEKGIPPEKTITLIVEVQ